MKQAWVVLCAALAGGCANEERASPSPSASATAIPSPIQAPAAPGSGAGAASGSTAAPATSAAGISAGAPAPPPATIIAQHILCIYKGAKRAPKGITRSKIEARARAQEALEKVRGGTPFEDLVKQFSDDAGSVDRMGSVGKFHRDDMDPAFSAAAFALKPGEVSDVVETPFGFHVIKRTQ